MFRQSHARAEPWHTACLSIRSKNARRNGRMDPTFLSATKWLALCGLIAVTIEPAMGQRAEPRMRASWEITGPLANTGAMMKVATETALDEINAAGGVLGQQLRLVVYEGVGEPARA